MDDDDYDDIDSGPDEFDELDKLVESAPDIISQKKAAGELNPKCDASVKMIQLMILEVSSRDVKVASQLDGTWTTEVLYKGITFITITPKKPEWETGDE